MSLIVFRNCITQASSVTRCQTFGLDLRLVPYYICASSEGPGVTARMRRRASEPSLLAYLISTKITCAGSYDFTSESVIKPYIKFDNPVAD